MFTAEDVRSMRATQEDAMPDTVEVTRLVRTDDGFGGVDKADTPRVIYAALRARVAKAQTQSLGGQSARALEVEKWIVRLPFGADIREKDLLVWQEGGITIRVDELKPRSWASTLTVAGERAK